MKLQNVKIVFIDLDGTSLDYKRKLLSRKNLEIIEKWKQKGIKFVVSTGRGINAKTQKVLQQLKSTGNVIAWNGSKILHNGLEVFSSPISFDTAKSIQELAKKHKISTIINSDFRNKTYTNNFFLRIFLWFKRAKLNKISALNIDYPVYKFIFFTSNKHKLNGFRQELEAIAGNQLNIVGARHYSEFIEVTHKDSSKGQAELTYASLDNIDPSQCLHIGDTMNDASTVNKVKHVIAMKNSTREFKKLATHISPFSYKKGGLGKTLDYFLDNKDSK